MQNFVREKPSFYVGIQFMNSFGENNFLKNGFHDYTFGIAFALCNSFF